MIASPLPAAAEAWFLSGEFFSPGATKGPFVQPGRDGARARRPIPADDQWSRATAFSVSRSPFLFISPILIPLSPLPLILSLFIFLLGRGEPSCLPLPCAYLINAFYLPCQDSVSWSLYQRRVGKGRESLSLSLPPFFVFILLLLLLFLHRPMRRSNAPFWYLVMFHYFPPESLRQSSHLPPKRRGLDSHRPTSVSRRRLNAHYHSARTH